MIGGERCGEMIDTRAGPVWRVERRVPQARAREHRPNGQVRIDAPSDVNNS